MTEKHDAILESVSVVMDGEHSDLDLRRILKNAHEDAAIEKKWSRYHLARQVLKKEVGTVVNSDFLSGVQDALMHEPEFSGAASNRYVPSWRQLQNWSMKAGTAACFTFAFLIGVDYLSDDKKTISADQNIVANERGYDPMAIVPEGFELPPLTARTVSMGASSSTVSSPARISESDTRVVDQSSFQSVALTKSQQLFILQMMAKHADHSAANGALGVLPYTRIDVSGIEK